MNLQTAKNNNHHYQTPHLKSMIRTKALKQVEESSFNTWISGFTPKSTRVTLKKVCLITLPNLILTNIPLWGEMMSALLTVIPKKIAHCSPKCSIRELKVLHWTILVPKLTRKSRVLKRFLPHKKSSWICTATKFLWLHKRHIALYKHRTD